MSRPKTIKEAVNKTLALLADEEYTSADDVFTICQKLIAQVHILELYRLGYTHYDIARELEVDEKTVRMWLNADHCPSLEHAVALSTLYQKAKKNYD
jgi:DNA-binding NarL/FixJ family response regulator